MVAKPIQSIAKNIRCQHHKGIYLKLQNPVTIAHRDRQSLKVASHNAKKLSTDFQLKETWKKNEV